MKHGIRFMVIFVALLLTLSAAHADTEMLSMPWQPTNASLAVQPRFIYTDQISVSLTFSGGKANCSGYVDPTGNDDTSITVSLYKQNGSAWSFVQSWSGSATGGLKAFASGSVSVGAGTYKAVASANVGGKEFPSTSVTKTKE